MQDSTACLRSVLTRLSACQLELVAAGEVDVARLLAITTLDIRLKLNNMGNAELRAICDASIAPHPD